MYKWRYTHAHILPSIYLYVRIRIHKSRKLGKSETLKQKHWFASKSTKHQRTYKTTDVNNRPRNTLSKFVGPIKWNQRSHIFKVVYVSQLLFIQNSKRMCHDHWASAMKMHHVDVCEYTDTNLGHIRGNILCHSIQNCPNHSFWMSPVGSPTDCTKLIDMISTYTYSYVYARTHTPMYIYIYICIHIYICMYCPQPHIYMYIYIHIHIHMFHPARWTRMYVCNGLWQFIGS